MIHKLKLIGKTNTENIGYQIALLKIKLNNETREVLKQAYRSKIEKLENSYAKQ